MEGGGEGGCSAWMRAKMYFFFSSLLYLRFELLVVGWITNPGIVEHVFPFFFPPFRFFHLPLSNRSPVCACTCVSARVHAGAYADVGGRAGVRVFAWT